MSSSRFALGHLGFQLLPAAIQRLREKTRTFDSRMTSFTGLAM